MTGLLAVWFQKADTVTAVFATDFTTDFPFDPQELFVFALMGYFELWHFLIIKTLPLNIIYILALSVGLVERFMYGFIENTSCSCDQTNG